MMVNTNQKIYQYQFIKLKMEKGKYLTYQQIPILNYFIKITMLPIGQNIQVP